MKSKIFSGLVAVALVATTGLFVAPPPALAATPVSISVSGGSSHAVGDTITVAQTGGLIDWCRWLLSIGPTQGSINYPWSLVEVQVAPTDGQCAPWTFVLPNLSAMVASSATHLPVVTITLQGLAYGSESNTAAINYAYSTEQPTPTSTLPMALWTVSDTKPGVGDTVQVHFYGVGFPADFPSGAGDFYTVENYDVGNGRFTYPTSIYPPTVPLTITSAFGIESKFSAHVLGVVVIVVAGVIDLPTAVTPTVTPLVAPSASATPTPVAPVVVSPTNDQSLCVALVALGWLLLLLLLLLRRRRRKDEDKEPPTSTPYLS